MPSLTPATEAGDVLVLDLGGDENRFHPDWMTTVSGLLEDVAHGSGARA